MRPAPLVGIRRPRAVPPRRRRLALALALFTAALLAGSACLAQPTAPAAELPFTEAVPAGDLLLLSGQLGLDPATGKLVAGGVSAEARQALHHVRRVLAQHGASLADVKRCTIFLADMADWSAFNAVYRTFFHKPYPARSAVGVSALAFGARVEVECLAYRPRQAAADRRPE